MLEDQRRQQLRQDLTIRPGTPANFSTQGSPPFTTPATSTGRQYYAPRTMVAGPVAEGVQPIATGHQRPLSPRARRMHQAPHQAAPIAPLITPPRFRAGSPYTEHSDTEMYDNSARRSRSASRSRENGMEGVIYSLGSRSSSGHRPGPMEDIIHTGPNPNIPFHGQDIGRGNGNGGRFDFMQH